MEIFGNHRERIITGLALVGAVLVIGLIDNLFLTWLVMGGIYILAFKEALRLFEIESDSLLIFGVAIWLLTWIYPQADDLFILAGVAYAGAIAYNTELQWKSFFPFLYPTAGMLFLFAMYQEYGMISIGWLVVTVAMTDVGAYAVGKSVGKTQFCQTSPNKTMEGVAGGIAVATISGSLLGLAVTTWEISLVVSFAVAFSSIFGDLFESSLKRSAGVKDSGDLLPGHGGVLDRIDGYLFSSIVMLILLRGLL